VGESASGLRLKTG